MMVDPGNRLVVNTLEPEWNDKLRVLAKARDDREREIREDHVSLDEKVRKRFVVMTTDFKKLWGDPTLPNRERKRLLAHIIEDVTLIKLPSEGTTKIHVRFKGGKTETLTTLNPKSSAAQVTTPTAIVDLQEVRCFASVEARPSPATTPATAPSATGAFGRTDTFARMNVGVERWHKQELVWQNMAHRGPRFDGGQAPEKPGLCFYFRSPPAPDSSFSVATYEF